MRTRGMQVVGTLAAIAALVPGLARARTEEIRWQQADTTNVAGFQIHWGLASGSYASTIDVGPRAPGSDGIYRYDITVPDDADVFVAMTAYNVEDAQSALSNERFRAAPPPPASPDPDPDPVPPAPTPSEIDVPFRINSGGTSLSLGSEAWDADRYATGGAGHGTIATAVSATENAAVYRSFRYGSGSGPGFGYEVPVANGPYMVRLHFAEGYTDAARVGARVFDVEIEGAAVVRDLDVFSEAGFATQVTRSFDVDVSDGSLSIFLARRSGIGPLISGIEILDAASAPPPPTGAPPGPPLLLSPQ